MLIILSVVLSFLLQHALKDMPANPGIREAFASGKNSAGKRFFNALRGNFEGVNAMRGF